MTGSVARDDRKLGHSAVRRTILLRKEIYLRQNVICEKFMPCYRRNIARFLARNGDGAPGAKTISQGMQRLLYLATGIRFYKDFQAAGRCE